MLVGVLLWVLLTLVCVSVGAERKRYDGHKVVEVTGVRTAEVARRLGDFVDRSEVLVEGAPLALEGRISLLIPPSVWESVVTCLKEADVTYRVVEENIQIGLDAFWEKADAKRRSPELLAYNYDDFNTYPEFMAELETLAAKCGSDLTCGTYIAGKSVEGRDLKVLTVSSGSGKPGIYMDSLTHAREWLSGATLMNIINKLITGYGNDTEATRLLDTFDFFFLPVVNPDGYEYSWTNDRMWRKNRKVLNSTCMGVDLNRNFDFRWGTGGSSPDPCSAIYMGPGAASEPEVQVVQAEATRVAAGQRMLSHISMHCYGQYILIPYGDCTDPADYDAMLGVAKAMGGAIERTHDTTWTVDNSCRAMYWTSGTTSDWCYNAGYKYSYTPELRGPGFDPSATYIPLARREMWNGYVALADEIASREGLRG